MKTLNKLFCILLALVSFYVFAQDEGGMPAPSIPESFKPLTQLIGRWEGIHKEGDEEFPVAVTYALTSAGTAITETLMEGTPQEMVSVYHKDGDSVAMTHYCALGNQPHMKMTKSNPSEMAFEMQEPMGITSENEPHMHAVTLKLLDNNTLEQKWSYYVDGKEQSASVFTFHRKM